MAATQGSPERGVSVDHAPDGRYDADMLATLPPELRTYYFARVLQAFMKTNDINVLHWPTSGDDVCVMQKTGLRRYERDSEQAPQGPTSVDVSNGAQTLLSVRDQEALSTRTGWERIDAYCALCEPALPARVARERIRTELQALALRIERHALAVNQPPPVKQIADREIVALTAAFRDHVADTPITLELSTMRLRVLFPHRRPDLERVADATYRAISPIAWNFGLPEGRSRLRLVVDSHGVRYNPT